MTTTDAIILRLIAFFALLRAMFRQVHLLAETNPAFRAVSTEVIPFAAKPSDYADEGVTISIALNAELTKPIDSEKKAMGISLLLRHCNEHWIAEAEIGWSGEKIGWDQFDEKQLERTTIEEIMHETPALVAWLSSRFKEEAAKLSN